MVRESPFSSMVPVMRDIGIGGARRPRLAEYKKATSLGLNKARAIRSDEMSKKTKKSKREVELNSLEQINLDAAGIDIGAEEIWVCVPSARSEEAVRRFDTFTAALYDVADWLLKCKVTTVAMESTGVYWIPIYEILQACGLEVCLVNARATKNVSGRKSDALDCQWIQQLHTYGLLAASFRPPADVCVLRTYVRQREALLQQRARQIQHMQKALHQMNLKLTTVISDITGVTGMQIIRAILAGEHTPTLLAGFRHPNCKRSAEEIAKALTGNYLPQHIFTLRQAVGAYDFFTEQLAACDKELEHHYAVFEPQVDIVAEPLPEKGTRRQHNQPDFDLRTFLYLTCGVDLTAIDGIDVLLAQDILAEIGTDMSNWKTVKHFASWLGLAPNNRSSAGKVKSRHTTKTKNRANTAFRIAAQAVSRSQSALGAFYRRIRAKHGAPVAITATAHKIARIVYHMLKHRTPYRDPGSDAYLEQQRQRSIRSLERLAKKLGFQVLPTPEPVVS